MVSIFRKEKTSAQDSKPEKEPEVVVCERLITDIINAFKSIKEIPEPFSKGVHFWIRDKELETIIKTESFEKNLRTVFDNHEMEHFGGCEYAFTFGKLADDDNPIIINSGKIEVTPIRTEQKDEAAWYAEISILPETGSLEKTSYTLAIEDRKEFHIGRGRVCRKNGTYRINDIVIRDNDSDKTIQNNNNCVSSAHCDIVVKDGIYYLRAMKNGCRTEGGSATKIIRDQIPIELRDVHTLFPLKDGDIIELGKTVMLEFRIITNNNLPTDSKY